jgi:hypothetical protein
VPGVDVGVLGPVHREQRETDMPISRPVGTEVDALSAELDAASHEDRVQWLRSLGKRELSALYDLASGTTVGVDHFYDDGGEVVIHYGKNSLPVFTHFQKRIVAQGDEIQGYNHQSMAWLTGPGHFILRASPEVEGEVWFDYTVTPVAEFTQFPPLRANDRGASRFVYAGMIDIVRRVSRDLTIGTALKGGKMTGDFFGLCRPPRATV